MASDTGSAEGGGGIVSVLKATWNDFGRDECGTRAAALAYSTVFALPPLLVLLVTVAGMVWGPAEVQRSLETQFAGIIGQSGAQQIHTMMARGLSSPGGGVLALLGSIGGLLVGATGALLSLQEALNRAWNVMPDPKQGGVKQFITKRLFSIGMLLGLGFLLAVSLAITAAVSALGGAVGGSLPKAVMEGVNFVVTFVVLAMLFAAMFKFLPDAKVAWRDVWVGGAVTALLFVIGKFAIGLYLGRSNPGDPFGAASALAVILVWAYYSGLIILLGAEFTQAWATQHGHEIEPKEGAVRTDEAGRHRGATPSSDELKRSRGAEPANGGRVAPARDIAASVSPSRGGIGDWLVGLPVVFLLLRGRRKER